MRKRDLRASILEVLTEDARIPAADIAAMVGSDEATVADEIKQMEKERIILCYTPVVDWQKVTDDEEVDALIEVKITPQRDYGYDDMARRIYQYDEVVSVYLMAGAYDLSVRVRARSIQEVSRFVWEKLAVIDGVTSTVTTFIMRKYKEHGVVLAGERADTRLAVTP